MALKDEMDPSLQNLSDSEPVRKRKRTKPNAPSTPRKPKSEVPTVDLTAEPTPRKSKKAKGSPAKSQSEEKRLRRFRNHAPSSYVERLHRAQSQRMFVIERTPDGSVECPEERISMAGSTGNIYEVHVCQVPSCTCPDARKGNQCKHIVYVLHNVLKAPERLQYQLALLCSELQEIFAAAPSPIASAKSSSEKEEDGDGDGAKRRPIDGDCPICFTPFEPETEEIVYCKAACGNNIHHDCFEQWAKSQSGRDVRCVYCRAPWKGDEEQVMRIVKSKIRNGETDDLNEGYVNVGSELGLSGQRDYSSYHRHWVQRHLGEGW